MKNIIILRGISNSGKSTWAEKQKDYFIISRDKIREDILGKERLQQYFNYGQDIQIEQLVTEIQEKEIARHLIKNHKIIIDNTNLKKKYIQDYINVILDIKENLDDVEIKTFYIDIDEALKRNLNREEKFISEKVIRKQYEQFLSYKNIDLNFENKQTRKKKEWNYASFDIEKYVDKKENSNHYIICDLDGTSAHRDVLEKRSGHLFMRNFYGYSECQFDKPDIVVSEILKSMYNSGFKIIFVSGRKESSRKFTESFIKNKLSFFKGEYQLFMRKDRDNRSDDIVKYEIFNEHLRSLSGIFCVFDDRKRVIAMWEELGIKVLNCGSLNDVF